MKRTTRDWVVMGLVASLTAACGGGGAGSPGSTATPSPTPAPTPAPAPAPAPAPSATAEGFYRGTTATNRTVAGFVLDDGSLWAIYSGVGQPAAAAGLIQGSITYTTNTSYTSSNVVKDFSLEGAGVLDATAGGTFTPKQALNGTVTYVSTAVTPVSFTASYNSAYEVTQTLASLAGTYAGMVGESPSGRENATLVLGANGTFNGQTSGGCTFSGQLNTRTTGSALSLALVFGGVPCARPGEVANGIAYYDLTSGFFYAGGTTTDRTRAAIFIARRS